MRMTELSAAVLAACALLSTGPASAGGPVVLSEGELDAVSAGSALSVAQALADAFGRRGTLTATGTSTFAREQSVRRFTTGASAALAVGDLLAATAVTNQSAVAGGGTAAAVAVDAGSIAAGGTSQSSGRTVARGGPFASVAFGTGVSVAVGGQTSADATAGGGATGNFLTITGQVVVPVNAGQASVAAAVPWSVAVSLPDSVNALLGR
jgi:hypothetical protein